MTSVPIKGPAALAGREAVVGRVVPEPLGRRSNEGSNWATEGEGRELKSQGAIDLSGRCDERSRTALGVTFACRPARCTNLTPTPAAMRLTATATPTTAHRRPRRLISSAPGWSRQAWRQKRPRPKRPSRISAARHTRPNSNQPDPAKSPSNPVTKPDTASCHARDMPER